FVKGDLVFRGRLYKDVDLNLDAHLDELCIQNPVTGIHILANKNFVDSFSMEGRQFEHYRQEGSGALAKGYYEVLFSGRLVLFKKIQKMFKEEVGSGSTKVRRYLLSETFYVQKSDAWYRVNNAADVKRLFPEHKRTIDNIVKSKALDFRNRKGEALIEILTYLDSL
ncbi:MAG: hypothetical protein FWD56_08275, partial [Bacteroidales bacterium]|nr:hypothetical protein [Bacteroidales bacterium]